LFLHHSFTVASISDKAINWNSVIAQNAPSQVSDKPIESLLRDTFRLAQFRLGQREAMDDLMAGHDIVCVMPTGAGKSLCYQLPAVAMGGLTIVVSPLIALMSDQVRQLAELGIPAMLLNSSQNSAEQRVVLNRLRQGWEGILYVAPERFAAPSFRDLLPNLKPRLLVIDEAHCVSFWGHDFRPDYMRLAEARAVLGSPVTAALTATATPQVRTDIAAFLQLKSPRMHVTGFDRPNLRYAARYFRTDAAKDAALLAGVKSSPGTGIIYCATRKTVELLAAWLEQEIPGRTICGYHAGMSQADRKHSQDLFMREQGAVIVATNAFGMGINKPNIRFVLHYSLPASVEAYYQEAGRAGRDGRTADCVLYHSTRDVAIQEFFIDKIGENNEQLKDAEIARLQDVARRKLAALKQYAFGSYCRRQYILRYFGQSARIEGCRCDACRGAIKRAPERDANDRTSKPKRIKLRLPKDAAPATLDAAAQRRFESLREARRRLAEQDDVPAFCVMHDKVLAEIARQVPASKAALLEISGIGERKAEKYGDALLAAIRPGN
jgi:ATP-dependent DNA helicase RecQ